MITREDALKKFEGEEYKNQMEALYKEQYDKELKFDEIEKRGDFLVGTTKGDYFQYSLKISNATYFVVPFNKGNLGKEGLLTEIETIPAHTAGREGYYYIDKGISLKMTSGKKILAYIHSDIPDSIDKSVNINAHNNAQVSAWLKQEYPLNRRYSIDNEILSSNRKNLSKRKRTKIEKETLNFARNFVKNFVCKDNEFVIEGERLKRVEKIGALREKISNRWEKEAKKKAQQEARQEARNKKRTAKNKLSKDVSEQENIMGTFMQKSIKDRIFGWFK